MNLLSSLVAGFAGAANGTAEIYIRGSSTRATWYVDFEASGSNSSGGDIQLDAYGAAEVYVNQLVDVKVKDEDGVLYREFTDGYASPNIEVISPAFTGHDYVTAAAAVNEPTTLQAVLDLWATNAGAPDWKVDIGGTDTSLVNALGSLAGLVYNVKSPAYGAVGDGVTNDQTAIQTALAAAVAAGGGIVYFPWGQYRITSAIAWDYRVHILMLPGAATSISIDSPTEKTLKFTAANATNVKTYFLGVSFRASQANTAACLSLEASQKLVLKSCIFGVTSSTNGHLIDATAAQSSLEVYDSRFVVNSSTKRALNTGATVAALRYEACTFVSPATYNDAMVDASGATGAWSGWFVNNAFDGTTNSTTTGGTDIWVRPGAYGTCDFSGNRFAGNFTYGIFLESTETSVVGNTFSGTGTAIESDGSGATISGNLFISSTVAINANGAPTRAFGNTFTSVTTRYSGAGFTYVQLDPYERVAGAGASYSASVNVDFTQLVSSGTNPAIAMPNGYYPGQHRKLHLRNTSGGNWAGVVWTGAGVSRVTGVPAAIINAGNDAMTSMIWTDFVTPGTYVWLIWQQN